MFKKLFVRGLIAITVLMLMVFSLVGCGGESISDGGTPTPTPIQGKYVYVLNAGFSAPSNVSIFSITDGTLNSNGAAVTTGLNEPFTLVKDPSGNYLYICNHGDNTIAAFGITPGAGTISPIGEPVSTGGKNSQVVRADPSGKYLYVANFGNIGETGSISIFNINAGTLSLKKSVTTGVNCPGALAVGLGGNYLYATNYFNNNISVFKITDGTLSPVDGSPFGTGGINPNRITIAPDGNYLYVTNYTSNNVSVFSITSSTGALTLKGTPVTTGGIAPCSLAIDSSGKYLFVGNAGNYSTDKGSISVFSIAAGVLSLKGPPLTTGINAPDSLAIDSNDGYLYVTNEGDSTIAVFSVIAGTLSPKGSPVNSGGNDPTAIVIY